MMALQWTKFRCTLALAAASIFGAVSLVHSVTWQAPVQLDLAPGSAIGFGQIGSDANGNAIALIEDDSTPDFTVLAYRYTGGTMGGSWGTPQTLFTATTSSLTDQYSLSMIPSGQAIAVWADTFNPNSSVYSAFFNGTSWSTPTPNPIATLVNPFQTVAVSMNDSGNALLVTEQAFPNTLSYATFTGGTWTALVPFTTISASNLEPVQLKFSNNGTAVAAWFDTGAVIAANYIGGVWTTTTVGSMNSSADLLAGIDSNGHAIVIWADPAGNIVYSYWNGSSWSPSANVSTASGNFQFFSFSMAPGGTAVAAWIDSSGDGIYSTFNGSTWAAPAQFASDTGMFSLVSVSTDTAGNALIMYTSGADIIEALTLPLGGSLSALEVVTSDFSIAFPTSSLSSNGVQFAFLAVSGDEGTDFFAAATLFVPPPPPPSPSGLSVSGSVCKNKFATQAEVVKTIKWTPLQNPSVASYTLSRNGTLIATISSSGPFMYRDHKRCKKGDDTYVLTARNSFGIAITSATIVL